MKRNEEKLILTIDVGTTATKAVLFNLEGNIVRVAHKEYSSKYIQPSIVDHDPNTWIQAITFVVPEVMNGLSPDAVSAVSVTSQRATIIPVDSNGEPLADAIHWQDKRTLAECEEIRETIDEEAIYNKTGLRIDPYFSLPKILWLKKQGNLINETAYLLTVHDFIIHYLTGEFKTDWTQASRTMLFNINSFQWDRDLMNQFNISSSMMPDAYPPGTVAGNLKEQVAKQLGLRDGIPVVMAGGDQQCAAVGLGVTRIGTAKVTTGTGSFVVAPVGQSIRDKGKRVLCSPSSIKGQWVMEAGIFTTGSIYRWLKDELISHKGIDSTVTFEDLNREASASQAGANGILMVPHFAGSASPYWNPKSRGIVFNLTLGHKRADIIRAFLEGIAFEINKNIKVINDVLRESAFQTSEGVNEVFVSGGLVKADLFNEIQANIFGRKVVPGKAEEATALGAAILAAVSIGVYRTVPDACEIMTNSAGKKAYQPDEKVHSYYQKLGKVHDKIYRSLDEAGVFEEI
ncbi:FGGY-family carbohydrate kinase [Pseudalkalibacillus caeni]|uniref:Carbohydrate kinase n=1 Tax=Exobacillus caeni TaxID=2574798 RepID=A0A5R9F9X0_9BACL|nr:FGGY-family carbohydrate kinase [Pseudalkalibacillus caeni]TLS38438.1 carbohydrate kinase [Pseudalkalibacillus caeni]